MNRIILSLFGILLLTACTPDDAQVALGTLERDRVTFTATSSEIIRALPVAEGHRVVQGQVLVQLDSQNQQALLARAKAEQDKAVAYLQKLTHGERAEDIAAARANVVRVNARYVQAEKNYRRLSELVRKKLMSQSEKDAALAARDAARAELKSARETLSKLTSGTRIEDIEQAEAALAVTKADVMLQQQKLAELTITATRHGILEKLPYHLGERVPLHGIVAIVQVAQAPYARVYVPETYRIRFVPGRKVSVHVDGSEKIWPGTVRWVASQPSFTPYYALTEDERSRLMYLAEIDLDDSAGDLPSGLPAQVDLQGVQ
jgi:HlyD family secretion protein